MPKPTFKQIKTRVEALRASRERAQGALDQISKRMQDEFGVTIDKAPAKHAALKKNAEKAQKDYDKAITAFVDEWGERLGLDDDA